MRAHASKSDLTSGGRFKRRAVNSHKLAPLKVVPASSQTLHAKGTICGAQTKTGTICHQTILPCARHTAGPQRKPKKWSARRQLMVRGILHGKSAAQAARDAGYSEKSAKGTIYRLIKSPETKRKINEDLKRARLNDKKVEKGFESISLNTDEFIGTLVGQMRGDLAFVLPESPLLRRASKLGVSQSIKRLKTKTRLIPQPDGLVIQEEIVDIELYSSQRAAIELCKIFGLKNLPSPKLGIDPHRQRVSGLGVEDKFQAAVARVMHSVRLTGITCPDEVLREKVERGLRPAFGLEDLTPNQAVETHLNPGASPAAEELSQNSEPTDDMHCRQHEQSEESEVISADETAGSVTNSHVQFLSETSSSVENLPQNSDANQVQRFHDSWPALFDRLAHTDRTETLSGRRTKDFVRARRTFEQRRSASRAF